MIINLLDRLPQEQKGVAMAMFGIKKEEVKVSLTQSQKDEILNYRKNSTPFNSLSIGINPEDFDLLEGVYCNALIKLSRWAVFNYEKEEIGWLTIDSDEEGNPRWKVRFSGVANYFYFPTDKDKITVIHYSFNTYNQSLTKETMDKIEAENKLMTSWPKLNKDNQTIFSSWVDKCPSDVSANSCPYRIGEYIKQQGLLKEGVVNDFTWRKVTNRDRKIRDYYESIWEQAYSALEDESLHSIYTDLLQLKKEAEERGILQRSADSPLLELKDSIHMEKIKLLQKKVFESRFKIEEKANDLLLISFPADLF